jgi:hypothetical protein
MKNAENVTVDLPPTPVGGFRDLGTYVDWEKKRNDAFEKRNAALTAFYSERSGRVDIVRAEEQRVSASLKKCAEAFYDVGG